MAINKTSGVDEEAFEKCGFPIPYKSMWISKREGGGSQPWTVSFDPYGGFDLVAEKFGGLQHGFNSVRGAKSYITRLQARWQARGIYEKQMQGVAAWEKYYTKQR